ncbi:sodium/proton-translocating pyrophosphatase [Candidatus Bathyarchaeota archaeon]|nr:sodium/proton-translocating pyrophosphatase [Candidatus Bathyarchaeota archaeon]
MTPQLFIFNKTLKYLFSSQVNIATTSKIFLKAHKAAIKGDTIGDPFSDALDPSLNTLITVTLLMS